MRGAARACRFAPGPSRSAGLPFHGVEVAFGVEAVLPFLVEYGPQAAGDREALPLGAGLGDRLGHARELLGLALREARRFEEAISAHQDAAAIYRETSDRHGEGMALGNLGGVYQEMGQPGRATECWRAAAEAMRDAGDDEEAARLERLAANAQPGQCH